MPGRRIRHWRRRSRQFLRPLVTSTFRLAFLGGLLFAVTNIALLGVVRWTTGSLLDQSVDAAVDGEVAQLQSVFASGGVAGLTGELSTRMASLQGRQRVYLLIGSDRVPIIGNIAAWPDAKASPSGRLSFRLPPQFEDWGSRVRGGVADFPGCCLLLVGRLQTDRGLFDRVIGGTMVGAGILCLFLGAVVGLVMARHALGRLDAINRIAAATRRGGFAERIQLSGSGDEFDQLAANLNAMLERNQRLLTAMRTVTRSVAHDLRTPLSRLRSRLESALLGEQAADLDGAQAAMAGAIRDVDGILATFNALLSIARIEGMTAVRTSPRSISTGWSPMWPNFTAPWPKTKASHCPSPSDRKR